MVKPWTLGEKGIQHLGHTLEHPFPCLQINTFCGILSFCLFISSRGDFTYQGQDI